MNALSLYLAGSDDEPGGFGGAVAGADEADPAGSSPVSSG